MSARRKNHPDSRLKCHIDFPGPMKPRWTQLPWIPICFSEKHYTTTPTELRIFTLSTADFREPQGFSDPQHRNNLVDTARPWGIGTDGSGQVGREQLVPTICRHFLPIRRHNLANCHCQ